MRVTGVLLCLSFVAACGDDAAPPAATDAGDDTSTLDVSVDSGADSAVDVATDTAAEVATDSATAETPIDASGTSVKCASVTCTSVQECCITGGVGSCIPKGGACGGGRYTCTSVDECPSGQVCCVSAGGGGGASCTLPGACPTAHTCKTSADCGGKLKNCVDLGYIKICST